MLTISEKINHFELYLSQKNNNYGDTIKEDLSIQFFDFDNFNFDFLKKLKTKKEIENKIEFIVSKIILHEHEDGINSIIMNLL